MQKFNPRSFVGRKSKESYYFRELTQEDAAQYKSFREAIGRETNNTYQSILVPQPSIEKLTERLNNENAKSTDLNLGVFLKSQLMGNLMVGVPMPEHPWTKHVANFGMMILKAHWGQGIGTELLSCAETFANSIGATRIEARVRAQNDRGIELYKRAGYQIEGTRECAGFIDGIYQDEYHIAKLLMPVPHEWAPPTLQTSRLVLRALHLQDAEAIFDYCSDPRVTQFTLFPTHQSIEDANRFIADYAFHRYRSKTPEPFGITLKENPNHVIGTVGCFWVPKSKTAMELGYVLHPNFWGKGLVAEAAEVVMDYCAREFALKRIQARCWDQNKASERVMKKIGMNFEGKLKASIFCKGQYWDMLHYAKIYP